MSKKNMPILAQWIEPECTIDDERSVGVTVARKVKLNGIAYEGAVTVEVFGTLGLHSNEALDADWPETWSGDESATLTPNGARRLARVLTVAAMTADSHRKATGIESADAPPKKSAIDAAVAQAVAVEREAIRAEIESRRSAESAARTSPGTHGFVAGFVENAYRSLLSWLDDRSKGGAR